MISYVTYFTIVYFIVLVISSCFYKRFKKEYYPCVSILIPVFNEGEGIYKTIKSITTINYSKNKFEVIVINDGSTDNSDFFVKKAKNDFNELNINYINLYRNKGKKHALIEGIKKSNGDVIITIDSDSFVLPNAVKNIVKPFVNKKIGGVAGNIKVSNIHDGIIPAMMDIIFCFCFMFLRSSQSVFGKVLCTPGALSAYRRISINPLLDEWKNQKFLGEYTTIGEDRALTCLLLKNNWDVVYQSDAIAKTKISPNYFLFCKMIIRWVRGDIRENILLFTNVLKTMKKFNFKNFMYMLHYLAFNLGILIPIVCLPIFMIMLILSPINGISMFIYMVIVTLIWSLIPALIYAKQYSIKKSLNAFTYGIFSLLCISWIPLYSIFTIKNNGWLTRK